MGRELRRRGDVPVLQRKETFVGAEFGADCAGLGELLRSWLGVRFGEEGLAGGHCEIQSEIGGGRICRWNCVRNN